MQDKIYEDDIYSRRKEICELTNMCMVQDTEGNIVALNKRKGGYVGLTFPGGHLEPGETICNSVIREVKEEAGIDITEPVFCGIYHWYEGNVHHMIFLYRADKFTGTLKGSEEGEVFWMPLEEYRKKDLATGMDQVLKIVSDEMAQECYMQLTGGQYREILF